MMLKRMIIMLVSVALTFGAVFGFLAFKARMISQIMAAQSNPPQAVSTAVVALAQWQPRLEAVGSARAVNGANLSSRYRGSCPPSTSNRPRRQTGNAFGRPDRRRRHRASGGA